MTQIQKIWSASETTRLAILGQGMRSKMADILSSPKIGRMRKSYLARLEK